MRLSAGDVVVSAASTILLLLLAGCSTPPPAGHTEAEMVDFVAQQNQLTWELMHPDGTEAAPTVAIERYLNSADYRKVWECLADSGVDVTFGDDGSVSWTSADDEAQKVTDLALYACQARFPIWPPQTGYITEEQHAYLYDYYQAVLVPCLMLKGLDVAPPPSREAFLDPKGSDYYWTPFGLISSPMTVDESVALNEQCPQTPFGAPVAD